ncbi:hypothetical protein K1T71_011355 [Dendrolimus kikuchii]|uniref:Uncharacterized protein n=1 Tax=Dendrolimus kikuchii TaxID=765133 RepID=A0ACC1CNI5_9NEOP|nr:hypothetical protein K1T71_011355 [Dendrolimus kikuchii]
MNSLVALTTLLCFNIEPFAARFILENYSQYKEQLIQGELNLSVGGRVNLTDDEKKANEVLMHWKNKEVEAAFNYPQYNNFSKHYFTYKDDIWKSKVYQIIKKMPKGAALHVHSSMMLDPDTLMSLTYEDHLYICYGPGYVLYKFFAIAPSTITTSCSSEWSLLSNLRSAADNVTLFDAELRKYFTLVTDSVEEQNADINYTWDKFNKVHKTIKGLVGYRPVREKYIYAALKKFYEDNIMYIEIRSGLHNLYELDGLIYDRMYLAETYKRVTQKFIEEHPDFIGIKLILTSYRKKNRIFIESAMEVARRLKTEVPDMYAGYDLVGQEDLGNPLSYYLPVLKENEKELNFYLHGGETNFYGTSSDENLFDVIFLGTKRIGHGYALAKHPHLMKMVMQKDIAVEVNVVSNVVLSLVRDVRNHPLATFLAFGLPVVLSSDDPGVWEADPLSHDFYIAFVGVASKHADLRLLKQLALNSLKYSALNDADKERAFGIFNNKWNIFIKELMEFQK